MIDHLSLNVSDMAASRAFYEAALAPLGFGVVMEWEGRVAFGPTARPIFFIGRREPVQSGLHIAFQAADRDSVDAFHAAALEAGGSDNGCPGMRTQLSRALLRRLRPRPRRQQRRSRLPHTAMTFTRGFDRKRSRDDRLPPGQYLERGFPVLSAGPTPHTPLEQWTFELTARSPSPACGPGTSSRRSRARTSPWTSTASPRGSSSTPTGPASRWTRCSTGSSSRAATSIAYCDGGYTTNLPVEDITGGKAWVVVRLRRLPARAGARRSRPAAGPAPVPLEEREVGAAAVFAEDDEPGFWEALGYHDRGDPWLEQRYQGD